MWDEGIESNWSRVAEGMMLEIREWRDLHPRATFTESEENLSHQTSPSNPPRKSDGHP